MATEFLYSHPVLRTPNLQAFKQTIESSPDLANQVKALTFVDTLDKPNPDSYKWLTSWIPTRPVDANQKEQEHIDAMKALISRILYQCDALQTLSLTLRNTYSFSGNKVPLENHHWITTRLRSLTVFGNTLEAMLTNFAFPQLEVLCVQNYSFSTHFQMPPMPRVHTLRLHQPMCGWERRRRFESADLVKIFPNLRSFEINKDPTFGSSVDNALFTGLENLDQLVYIENTELRKFDWSTCSALKTVKHLTLGAIGYSEDCFTSWNIPSSVEDLVIFVAIEPRFIFEPMWRQVPVQHVVRWIAHNRDHHSFERGSLRRLEINIGDTRDGGEIHPRIMKEMEPMMQSIREICRPFKIALSFNQIGLSALQCISF